jgi:protein-tyrosine phosphatase
VKRPRTPERFRVLHVCTGNICRSPMAERLTRAGLEDRLGADAALFEVGSAGTLAHAGEPMEPFALSTLASYDVDGADFRARALLAEQVEQADLVLGATREHRAAAVVLHPRASRRSFTLREFARLAGAVDPAGLPTGDPVARMRALVAAAATHRGMVRPDAPRDDDLDDPYQSPQDAFTRCGELVVTTLRGPLDLLAG